MKTTLNYSLEQETANQAGLLECEAKHWIRENKGVHRQIADRLLILEQKRGAPQDALRAKINELLPRYHEATRKAKEKAARERQAVFDRNRNRAA